MSTRGIAVGWIRSVRAVSVGDGRRGRLDLDREDGGVEGAAVDRTAGADVEVDAVTVAPNLLDGEAGPRGDGPHVGEAQLLHDVVVGQHGRFAGSSAALVEDPSRCARGERQPSELSGAAPRRELARPIEAPTAIERLSVGGKRRPDAVSAPHPRALGWLASTDLHAANGRRLCGRGGRW